MMRAMSPPNISVVIPTLNAATELSATLAALQPGRVSGLVGEIVVADGGSSDATTALAAAAGSRVIQAPSGRGPQLVAGGAAAVGDWLLFLHADTRLAAGWETAAAAFIAEPANAARAAVFAFALDDAASAARRLERLVDLRYRLLALPYGDQGLLLAKVFYRELGGFRPLPLMEDVDIIRRIGRQRLARLPVPAVTSAARYRRDGYLPRTARNIGCITLYMLGVPPRHLLRLYG
jgi:rSAM/selenodomain-associated transferase 2